MYIIIPVLFLSCKENSSTTISFSCQNPVEYYTSVSTDEVIQTDETQKQVITELRDWDLWGPLIGSLLLSILLSFRAPTHQASDVFASVFVSMTVGSAIVTLNAQLLGGTLSFFQSVCVLGYSVFPFILAAIPIVLLQSTVLGTLWLNLILVLLGLVWATRVSIVFIGQYIARERRLLAVYPVFFYYIFLAWMVLLF